MIKKLQRVFICVVSVVFLLFMSSCSLIGGKYTYDYVKLTNIKEQTENYRFSFTVENISDEDIRVVVRVFLKTGGVVDSGVKEISRGNDYTFTCVSNAGKFYENPKGMVIIYNSAGASVENFSFEFDI